MKNIIYLFLLFTTIIALNSCEDIIELDLKDTNPRVVIEANINATNGDAKVIITSTNNFYDNSIPKAITNAEVEILNDLGGSFYLIENQAGVYELSQLEIIPGKEYFLRVKTIDIEYTAKVIAPQKVGLLSLDTILVSPPIGPSESFYQIESTWKDSLGTDNYYRLRTFVDGEPDVNSIAIFNDNNLDGEKLIHPIRNRFESGSLIKVELMSIDRSTYRYFLQLQANSSQGLGSSQPFNPSGNLSNDALGYFGIFQSSFLEIQL